MKRTYTVKGFILSIIALIFCGTTFANTTYQPVRYQLIEGSTLTIDYGPISKRPLQEVPINGQFFLEELPVDCLERIFDITKLEFTPIHKSGYYWGHNGSGQHIFFEREKPQMQKTTLKVFIDRGGPYILESKKVKIASDINFPWIDITLSMRVDSATNSPIYALRLIAVPLSDLWFTTEMPFTSGTSNGINKISDGDVLNANGKVICANKHLTKPFQTASNTLGLDALAGPSSLERAPEILFSTEDDFPSSPFRWIGEGDLLSDHGKIKRRNSDLFRAFSPMSKNLGLDGITRAPRNSMQSARELFLFSAEQGFFSELLGQWISDGDLLLENGSVFKNQKELLRNFHPIDSINKIGLDAVQMLPHNEIWFSVDRDFTDKRWGLIRHGDLLSENGRIIFRNRHLMNQFHPLEKCADFGLDGLWVGQTNWN